MSHLEALLAEYYQWCGYVVKCNALVGRRARGGWEMELDVVAYQPNENRILHVEPSLDANSWEKREQRFVKRFEAGRKYIFSDLFPWLPADTPLQQRAILISAAATRRTLAGAEVITVDEFMAEVRETVRNRGVASRAAIPEQYPMLRCDSTHGIGLLSRRFVALSYQRSDPHFESGGHQRMMSVARQELLNSLAELSEAAPELRLGQMVANIATLARGAVPEAVWDAEDEEVIAAARSLVEHYRASKASVA